MADLGEGGFDANKVEPNSTAVPAGEYDVVITESKWENTKKGDGKFLTLKMQILNGAQQNRVLFDRLNLQNPNATAVQIAKGTLSSICRAVNVMTPKDSAELHNRPLRVTVTLKNDPERGPQNEVKGYKSRHVGGGGAPAPNSPSPAAPQSGAAPYAPPAVSGQQTPW